MPFCWQAMPTIGNGVAMCFSWPMGWAHAAGGLASKMAADGIPHSYYKLQRRVRVPTPFAKRSG